MRACCCFVERDCAQECLMSAAPPHDPSQVERDELVTHFFIPLYPHQTRAEIELLATLRKGTQ